MTRDEAIEQAIQHQLTKQQLERELREEGITDVKNHPRVINLQQRLDILRALFY